MRLFIFEFVTGGGWHTVDPLGAPAGSLLREGKAMLNAVAADFAALPGVDVTTFIDARLPQSPPRAVDAQAIRNGDELCGSFARAAAAADGALLIAPEFDGHLLRLAEEVVRVGGTLLSPGPDFIRLTADKHATAQCLAARSILTPTGIALKPHQPPPSDFRLPAVYKPRDGAGSTDVRLIENRSDLAAVEPLGAPARLESYHRGRAVSVAALCGPAEPIILPPCAQHLSDDGRFTYLGGSCPIDDLLAKRASRLADRALQALPPAAGYVGIDMVLGEDASGAGDVVIEVNPRLTTSYVGLRAIIRENLARAMLTAAKPAATTLANLGGEHLALSTRGGRVKFSPDGRLRHLVE